ncbi:MAG: ABC transporter permease subunit, partial [Mesorhizobium sp.]
MTRALLLLRRRLVGSVFVLLIVVIGTFLLLEAAPGDAVDAYIVSTGGDAGMIELLRHRWGLDQSALTRLANYLGIYAGARPGGFRDRLLSIGSLALYAVPGFWLGLVLIIVFAVDLRWFPIGGIESIAFGKTGLGRAADIARHLVLPVS